MPSERDREFWSPVFYTAAPKCACIRRLADAHHLTGRFVKTVTRGWVGATNERAPFRFHGAVVGFVDRCLSRTRNLAASNKHLAELFSGRSWPKIGPGIIFFGVFEKFETFFRRFVLMASGTDIFWRDLIQTFYGNIAFPLPPVLGVRICIFVQKSRFGQARTVVRNVQRTSSTSTTQGIHNVCTCVRTRTRYSSEASF